jgi:aspartate 1-decarboxylase
MQITMLKSKIHRATVTEANLDYEGSVSICPDLMDYANILPFEQVHLWDITNGNRLITYALKGKEKQICVNGAGAKLIDVGDLIIIATFAEMSTDQAKDYDPKVVSVNEFNVLSSVKYG